MGWLNLFSTITISVMAKGLAMCAHLSLTKWTKELKGSNITSAPQLENLQVYGAFGAGFCKSLTFGLIYVGKNFVYEIFLTKFFSALMGFCAGFVLAIGAWNASYNLHGNALKSILRLPMSYFDTNPTGRILNRFLNKKTELKCHNKN